MPRRTGPCGPPVLILKVLNGWGPVICRASLWAAVSLRRQNLGLCSWFADSPGPPSEFTTGLLCRLVCLLGAGRRMPRHPTSQPRVGPQAEHITGAQVCSRLTLMKELWFRRHVGQSPAPGSSVGTGQHCSSRSSRPYGREQHLGFATT